jgi:hypothetical protein
MLCCGSRSSNLDIKFVPITNFPRKQETTLRPRVNAEATEEPMRIMGPSGPENRHADTVTMVPNSFTNTVLEATVSRRRNRRRRSRSRSRRSRRRRSRRRRRRRRRRRAPEAEEVGDVDAIEVGDDLEGA